MSSRLSFHDLVAKQSAHPEHFHFIGSPPAGASRTERIEMYLDTPTFDLRRQNIYLRLCYMIVDNRETGKPEWTLKKKASREVHRGQASVMRILEELFGKNVAACNPISYCGCAIVVLRVRRYTFTGWWVDVCYFKKTDDLYVVGTVCSQDTDLLDEHHFQVECPVPSKVEAYLAKYHSLGADTIQAPPAMFIAVDPFGGGPFLPLSNDSNSSEEDEDEDV